MKTQKSSSRSLSDTDEHAPSCPNLTDMKNEAFWLPLAQSGRMKMVLLMRENVNSNQAILKRIDFMGKISCQH